MVSLTIVVLANITIVRKKEKSSPGAWSHCGRRFFCHRRWEQSRGVRPAVTEWESVA
jgi:hypothetical protein